MAFDGFMKIKGIDGESTNTKHQGWIEISDCNMEIMQTVSATASSSGGASAERAYFSDICFTKLLDKSSPQLALVCAKGTHFDAVTVELCRAGSEKIKFMEIKLSDALISHIAMNAGSDFPNETIRLNYGKILEEFGVRSALGRNLGSGLLLTHLKSLMSQEQTLFFHIFYSVDRPIFFVQFVKNAPQNYPTSLARNRRVRFTHRLQVRPHPILVYRLSF